MLKSNLCVVLSSSSSSAEAEFLGIKLLENKVLIPTCNGRKMELKWKHESLSLPSARHIGIVGTFQVKLWAVPTWGPQL